MSTKKTKTRRFARETMVKTLKGAGDRRWKTAARRDLQELCDDEEGRAHLASAIKAVLRSDRWRRKKG